MNLLALNMSNWCDWPPRGKFINRNYHILRQLEQKIAPAEYEILIDFIPFDLRKLIKNATLTQWQMARYPVVAAGGWYQMYQIAPRRYVILTWIDARRARLRRNLWRQIRRIMLPAQARWTLWSYQPTFPEPFLEEDLFDKKVFDLVDDWRTHDIHAGSRAFLNDSYPGIITRADYVFAVSDEARARLASGHPRAYTVPNGVDYKMFSQVMPARARDDGVINIGYTGIIESRFDVELVEKLAKENPRWIFHLVGKVFPGTNLGDLRMFKNVIFYGQVPYDKLPSYFGSFHVGIIPHRITAFTASMNPLKLYEYLAAGLPCVATPLGGIEMIPGAVWIAKNANEFGKAIRQAAEAQSPALVEQRRASVAPYSWDQRFAEMNKHLLWK